MIVEKAYAKLNLVLDVTNKRKDGYHNLNSVMVPLNFYDTITFEVSDKYILESNLNLSVEDNIITKTYKLMKELYNIKPIKVKLEKVIPQEAGLAGGSADCSATIRGINRLFNLNLDNKSLECIANKLGSDTLFCLYNKPAIVTSRGDEITFIDSNFNSNFLLIKPNYGFSTKEIFNNFIPSDQRANINLMVLALKDNNIYLMENNIFNNLQPICLNLNSDYKSLYKEVCTYKKCYMSGSGSTLFIVSNNIDELEHIVKMLPQNIFKKIVKML